MQLDKRRFLKTMTMALLGRPRSGEAGEQHPQRELKCKRVVVIGAGLAGLAAARELQAHEYDVIVIEARGRIGGRVWTSHEWEDIPLDLGASWIHGVKGNPLTDLADEIKAQRLVTRYDSSVTYNTAGVPLDGGAEDRLDNLREELLEAISHAQKQDQDVSLRQAIMQVDQEPDGALSEARWI